MLMGFGVGPRLLFQTLNERGFLRIDAQFGFSGGPQNGPPRNEPHKDQDKIGRKLSDSHQVNLLKRSTFQLGILTISLQLTQNHRYNFVKASGSRTQYFSVLF